MAFLQPLSYFLWSVEWPQIKGGESPEVLTMAYQVRTMSADLPIKWEVGMQFAYF